MALKRRIIVVDRSELAANMYRLLLAGFDANLVVRKRFEEARPHFFRRDKIDLGIFNSNVFGKKIEEIIGHILNDEPISKVNKIFICKDSESDEDVAGRLSSVPNSCVIRRPFHPSELSDAVLKILGKVSE